MDSKTLAASAQRWMNTGLEAFARGTDLDFAVHGPSPVKVGTRLLITRRV
ncbi:hypothetical protein [Streptomyces sp. NBC_00154]|nr:hypothetical protein [Streptomyces sp. NBC_00154]MCX5318144.1 hypothetical protein [Streptomyces sp. NBC_00154]